MSDPSYPDKEAGDDDANADTGTGTSDPGEPGYDGTTGVGEEGGAEPQTEPDA